MKEVILMIKAVLFDFDGTLADTNPLIIRNFEETFAQMLPERTFEMSEIIDCIGPTLKQTGERYFPADVDGFIKTYRKFNAQYHDEMITIYPGVQKMLKALKEKGLKLAIVSSKKRELVAQGLECLDIHGFFDHIIGSDDVVHPKPHPEAINQALDYYGLTPEVCLMVGDNSHDIDGAKAAGVESIAVGWALRGADYLRQFNPDYIVNDAMEIVKIVDEHLSDGGILDE